MLTELKNSKRKLVLFLMKGPKTIYEIRDQLKVSDKWAKKITDDMNHNGVVSFRINGKTEEKTIILDTDKVKIRHKSDEFVPDLLVIIGTIFTSFLISSVMGPVFLFGAIFAVIILTFRIMYKIFKIADIRQVFVDIEEKRESDEKEDLPYSPNEK